MSSSTPSADVRLSTRPLFGGAISLDLPTDFLDASDLRQIPDNQEVFLSSGSDTNIILEVLGMVEDDGAKDDLWKAAQFHFSSIAHDNASLSSTILTPGPSSSIPSNPSPFPPSTSSSSSTPTPLPVILAGTQSVHKFSHDPTGLPRPGQEGSSPDNVWVGMALWRVWLQSDPQMQPTGQSEMRIKKADLVLSANVNLSAEGAEEERGKVERWFPKLCASLKIEDYNLFGDE